MLKKRYLFLIMIVCLFTISAVSATQNITDDIFSVEETNDDFVNNGLNEINEYKINNNDSSLEFRMNDSNNGEEVLCSGNDDDLISYTDETILGSLPYQILIFCEDTVVLGSSGAVSITLHPYDFGEVYSYDFVVDICDSNGNPRLTSQRYYSNNAQGTKSLSYNFNTGSLNAGAYTVKIVDYNNYANILATKTFTLKYKLYDVSVQDTSISSGSSGSISMTVSPSVSPYSYDFYLKIYDSKNNLKINERYYYSNVMGDHHLYYTINPNTLSDGVYTIKIIKSADNILLNTAKLTIGSGSSPSTPYVPNYSVNVKSTTLSSDNGGLISIFISPIENGPNSWYRYHFHLKVYDSNNNEVISKYYAGETNESFYEHYSIDSNQLSPGKYTIKIIDVDNEHVFDTEKLTMESTPETLNIYSGAYSVHVSDVSIGYGMGGNISVSISPASDRYEYKYDFYLKIYDSDNVLKFSRRYRDTTPSKLFTLNINPASLNIGIYTIEISDANDKKIMDSAKLNVVSIPYYAYSVKVYDNITLYYKVNYITDLVMSVSPTSSSYKSGYDFYLKIYDSDNDELISRRYHGSNSDCSVYYNDYPPFIPGIYTIKLINAQDNYLMDTARITIKSTSHSRYSVSIPDTKIEYGEIGSIQMSVSVDFGEYYNHHFYLKIYDSEGVEKISKSYYGDCSKSETYTIGPKNLDPGVYTIKVLNTEDKYVMTTATLSITSVPYKAYSVRVSDTTINQNDVGLIKMSISQIYYNYKYKYDFYLKIYDSNNDLKISERYFSSSMDYSLIYNINSTDLGPGVYTIKIFNSEDNHVMATANLIVNKLPSETSLSFVKNNDNSVTLTASVSPSIASGNVVFTVNNVDYTAKLRNSKATYTLNNLDVGSYDAKATYKGDYESSTSNSVKFTIEDSVKYAVIAPDLTKYYRGSERFVVTVKENNKPVIGKDITININGVTSTRSTDSSGMVSMAINLNSGEYDVVTEYGGIKAYSTVTVKDTVVAKDFTKIFRNGTQYYGTFVDSKGNLIKNTDIQININGVFYTRTTNDQGVARMNINLNPGTYILTATNPLSGEQHTTKITVLPSIVENHDLTKYYKNASKYTLRILGSNGKPVGEGVEVKLNINGVFYTRTTNASGYINMNINLPPGTYTVTAEYNGLRASNKITVMSVLKTKDLSMKYKDGSKFEAKILDGQGKPYVGQTVTFNINGVFYPKTTGPDGIARLAINLPAGEYIITSMFNGLNAANKVTISG